MSPRRVAIVLGLGLLRAAPLAAQSATPRPALTVGPVLDGLRLDGRLDEAMWAQAQRIERLVMTEPLEGGVPTCTTTVWVLADRGALVIGVRAADPDPARITSFAIARDADLDDDDHVRIVIDPFLDGRSGYVFAVNPRGSRFDALVSAHGEEADARWDGVWEAPPRQLRLVGRDPHPGQRFAELTGGLQRRAAGGAAQEVSRAQPSRTLT
jgi:hypothetical protein